MFKCSVNLNISSISFIPPKGYNSDLPLSIYAKKRKDNHLIKKQLTIPTNASYMLKIPMNETISFRSTLNLLSIDTNNKPKFNTKIIPFTMSQINPSNNVEKIFFTMYLPLHKIVNKKFNLTKLLGISICTFGSLDRTPVGSFIFRIEYSLKEVGLTKLFRKSTFHMNNTYDSDSEENNMDDDEFDLQTYDFSMASDQKEDSSTFEVQLSTIDETKEDIYLSPEYIEQDCKLEPVIEYEIVNDIPEPDLEPEPEPEPKETIFPEPQPEPVLLPPPPPPSILYKELYKYPLEELPPPLVRPFNLKHENYHFEPSVYIRFGSLNTTLLSKQTS